MRLGPMVARTAGCLVAVVLVATDAGPARAGQPTDHLRTQIDRVLKILDDSDLKTASRSADRQAAIRKVAEDTFDFNETAKRSLAVHWQARTSAERAEFVQLFASLLERAYVSKIEVFNGQKVMYLEETVDGDHATVRTRIVTDHGSEVPVDYRMLRRGARWLVYDVIIEGVSLVANYRAQFNRIIRSSSYQELVKKMKSKQEEFIEQDKPGRT